MLATLLIGHFDSVSAILDRMAAHRRKEPIVHVASVVEAGGTKANLDMWLDRGNVWAKVKINIPGEEYVYLQNRTEFLEYDTSFGRYDRFPNSKGEAYHFHGSRITGLPAKAFPWILVANIKAYVAKAKLVDDPRGARVDWVIDTQQGPDKLAVVIDKEGRPIWLKETLVGPSKEWTFKYLSSSDGILPSTWSATIPTGYTAVALPLPVPPLEPGNAFPLGGWTDSRAMRPVSLAGMFSKRVGIVAVLGEDAPSAACLTSLNRLKAKGIPVVLIASADAKPQPGWLFDATGRQVSSLVGSATPTFFFVNPEGKLDIIMQGYEASKAKAFEAEAERHAAGKE